MTSPIVRVLGLNLPSGEYQKEVTGFFGYHSELKGVAKLGLSSALHAQSQHYEPTIRHIRNITVQVDISDKVGSSLTVQDDNSPEGECNDDEDGLRSFEGQLFFYPILEGVEYLRFRLTFDEQLVGTVCALQHRDNLFIPAPEKDFEGALLSSLLDYVGETLECKAVVICIKKDRGNRASVMRSFMFMGFETLHPNHSTTGGLSTDFVFMAYALD